MESVGTSFRQFEYCSLCKYNHRKRKKHIYSNRHQEILSKIVEKFSKKMAEAKDTLKMPVLKGHGFEKGAKFWCYFCAVDVDKHQEIDVGILQYGGLIEHTASPEHSKQTDDFFWKNILEKKLKGKFLISEEDLKNYKISAELATRQFTQKQEDEKRKSGMLMHQEDFHRQNFYQWQLRKSMSEVKSIRNPIRTEESMEPRFVGKKTVIANGPGLACLQSRGEDGREGNIFTGATPPWLKEDESETGNKEIGPTLQDYKNHLTKEKKKKLPPNRVGANFDRSQPSSSHWLPSFGRVWSKGRRLQSKIFFEKELRKSHTFSTESRQTGSKSHISRAEDVVIPHKKIRHDETTWPSYDNQNISSVRTSCSLPYKRKEKTETISRTSNQQMIATPLLFTNKKYTNQSNTEKRTPDSEKIYSHNDNRFANSVSTGVSSSMAENKRETTFITNANFCSSLYEKSTINSSFSCGNVEQKQKSSKSLLADKRTL